MLTFLEYLNESDAPIKKKLPAYSDEHAHVNVWNHMVNKGIAHDKDAMHEEYEAAKTDKTHPLHFNAAKKAGFRNTQGKKSTSKSAKNSFDAEHSRALDTVHALATHPDFKKAVQEKHEAKVTGASKGTVSDTWAHHGATNSTSKTDIAIRDKNGKHAGIKLSLKSGAGSQLMSAEPNENAATHDYASRQMLNEHPNYKKKPEKEKDAIHADIAARVKHVNTHLSRMKTATVTERTHERKLAQQKIDETHHKYPELNSYVRKEGVTGIGKFGKNSAHAATYIVKSATPSKSASVHHVDNTDFSGPALQASAPKDSGRPGNVKALER